LCQSSLLCPLCPPATPLGQSRTALAMQVGIIVKEEFCHLYASPTNPKRMEIRRCNLKKIHPGDKVWVLGSSSGTAVRGYRRVIGQVSFESAVVIEKHEYNQYMDQRQCALEDLPTNFVRKHGKEFVWGWKWSSFTPFQPADEKVFLPIKRGTVTWQNFNMDELVSLIPLRVCEFCGRCYPGEQFPFPQCRFCGDSPSWHHGRCCLERPRGNCALCD